MDVIEKARELGKLIQETEEYQKLMELEAKNEADTELTDMIGQFQMKRLKLNKLMQQEEKDDAAIHEADQDLKEMYEAIMSNENMMAYSQCQHDMEYLMTRVNFILTCAANGEDPMTCPSEPDHGCGGNCSGCSGCH